MLKYPQYADIVMKFHILECASIPVSRSSFLGHREPPEADCEASVSNTNL